MSKAGRGQTRHDSKRRVLRSGESVRADGKYQYKYHIDGKPHFVYSWKLEPTDKLPKGKKPCLSLRELEKQVNTDLDLLVNIVDGQMTVCELVDRYLKTKTGVRQSTKQGYVTVQRLLAKEAFGKKTIRSVKTSDAKLFLIKLQQEDGKSYSSIHTIRGVLRPAFQMAVDDDILVKNPCGFQLAGVLVNDAVTREAITKDQMRKFLKFVHDDVVYCKYYEVVYILFHTGMRISEFCGLTLKDIDLENRTVNIDHQLQRTSDMRYIIETTKTDAGTRVLPIIEDVAQMFQAIIEDRNSPKVEKSIDGYSGFLFYDDNGMPLVAMHWQHRFNHMVGRYNDIYRVQMQYKPHDYQQYAINYILEHPIAAVILGMGLGKTSITLTAIEQLMYDSFEINKVLVVAPLRVARNTWSDEIHKWEHLKHLKYSIVLGTAADRKKALAADADIYVINRENLQWLVEQIGVPFDFDMVVLDELSSFKNWNSKRFKAFMKVRPKVKRVIGLTGTPSSNGLMDLFAEFKCLDMGERLGRFISQYRVNYFVPDQTNGQIVYSYRLRKGAEEQIYNKISDITISMKALDHLKMPELISNEYPVYMSENEVSLYDDMEAEMFLPLRTGEITAANAAALSGKLLQMANGAVYSDDGDEIQIHDQKLDALEDLIEAANGKPVMVAYWFKHDLTRIKRRLSERKISFEKLDSEESIRKWNRGELPVALIHPASAGHGLNLQSGGNILIWFGLTWSLELYQQTVARLWRQGQSAETVVVQHIITAGTIDEDVMKALADKGMTQNRLIAAVKARVIYGR